MVLFLINQWCDSAEPKHLQRQIPVKEGTLSENQRFHFTEDPWKSGSQETWHLTMADGSFCPPKFSHVEHIGISLPCTWVTSNYTPGMPISLSPKSLLEASGHPNPI